MTRDVVYVLLQVGELEGVLTYLIIAPHKHIPRGWLEYAH